MLKNKLISLGKNILVLLSSLIICFLFVEFVLFRYIIHVSDLPVNTFVNGMIKYVPYQEGKTFIDNYEFNYKINAQGWNSKHQQYFIERNNKFRIAIIGDSFVEGFMVNFDKSLAEQLETSLGEENFEVYRFAVSGACLSQYLHILREEVSHYNPDLVVIVIIQNDFVESYEMMPGRFTSSFLKLKFEKGKEIQELAPTVYNEKWWEFIMRNSATLRYLRINFKMQLFDILGRYFFSDSRLKQKQPQYQANIDVSNLKEKKETNIQATAYIFHEIVKCQKLHNFQILLLMNADIRGSIYPSRDTKELYDNGALSLNLLAAEAASKWGLPFIDLQPIFARDYQLHKKRFDYIHDGHWNEYGHRIAAQTIYQFISDKGWLANR